MTEIRSDAYLPNIQRLVGQVLAVTLNGESIDDILSVSIKDISDSTPGLAFEPIKDHLGSIRGWTESNSGTVVQKQNYSAYGKTTVSSLSPVFSQLSTLRGYTSREYDKDIDLYYYRARYYDPGTGRFLSEDPIRFGSRDPNFFRYVENAPVLLTDPRGQVGLGSIFDGVGGIFAGNPGAVIGGVIGGGLGAILGGVPGAIAGGIIGDQLGEALWPIKSDDPDADDPNHPKYDPISPSPIPPHVPPLKVPPSTPNTCSGR